MVAKVISGKDIQGALNYNEQKVKAGVAKCIMANRFPGNPEDMNFYEKLNRLLYFTDKNKRVKTNTLHISLNFDPGEKIPKEKLNAIASSFMEKIGFGDQPYLVYEHRDAAHPHIHIITTNIKDDGKRIDIHNIGRNQSEKARRDIEREFNLIEAESKKKEQQQFIKPIDIQKAIYGQSETKRSISNIVRMVSKTYKYTSLPELNTVLKQYNVLADRGTKGSLMYEKKGLVYSLIDEKGNKVGIPIKASSIYGKPTLSFLEKQFRLNEALRKPHKEQIKNAIDEVLNSNPKNLKGMVKMLDKRGIHVAIRKNTEGRIFGITYIDNRTKCVFNGSDLGKFYAAKGIHERLHEKERKPEIFRPGYSESKVDHGNTIKQMDLALEMDHILKDLAEARSMEYLSPEAAMKLRKKKRRKGRSL